jgi:hypothetical protein
MVSFCRRVKRAQSLMHILFLVGLSSFFIRLMLVSQVIQFIISLIY